MSRYENRVQLALALVIGLLLLANLFTLTLVALTPQTRAARAPVLLTVFVITLIVNSLSRVLIWSMNRTATARVTAEPAAQVAA